MLDTLIVLAGCAKTTIRSAANGEKGKHLVKVSRLT